MKVSELRIGNKFLGKNNAMKSWRLDTVTEIGVDGIGSEDNVYGEHQIKPVPLTEEWLLRFGFYNH